jgi:hypothetical protein
MAGQGKRTRWSAATAGVVGLAAALGVGVPAHATTPLSIAELVCIPQGANLMECFVEAAGGVQPYVYHWSTTAEDNDDVIFGCSTAFPPTGTASITVTDAAGGSVSGSRDYTCVGGNER